MDIHNQPAAGGISALPRERRQAPHNESRIRVTSTLHRNEIP